jgi:uncharacterized protein GlcG (DUF336 family)
VTGRPAGLSAAVRSLAALLAAAGMHGAGAADADATFATRSLTPEAALKVAQAALARCRAEGYQVTVAVVDRAGLTQALLRDRFAGPHTVDTAQRKAQTAVNFKMNTAALDREFQPGKPAGGLRHLPGVVAVAGGRVIEAGGSLLGAIGVSGAPGPANDDVCAAAGIGAVADDLELQGAP